MVEPKTTKVYHSCDSQQTSLVVIKSLFKGVLLYASGENGKEREIVALYLDDVTTRDLIKELQSKLDSND